MKKKVFIFIGALILGFVLYVGIQIYRPNQLELISTDAIRTISISTNNEGN